MDERIDRAKPSTSSNCEDNFRDFCCMICRGSQRTQSVLRVIMKERSLHMVIVMIQLTITNGIITERSKKNMNFLKFRHDEQGSYPSEGQASNSNVIESLDCAGIEKTRPSFCTKHQRSTGWIRLKRRSDRPETSQENDGELFTSFLARLAKELCLSIYSMNQTVNSIITAYHIILVDLNLGKLRKMCGKSVGTIEDIICNMFWKPSTGQEICSQCNKEEKVEENILLRCVHVIERSATKLFSWYMHPYFYHGDTYQRPESYAGYLQHLRYGKIENPFITVIDANPLLLNANFAHVVACNFYSHQRYIREYMSDIGLLTDPIFHLENNAPFVVRSLNPKTRMHIFHMVYKNKTYNTGSYPNLYKVLLLLRDAMERLHLHHVAMPKIGCKCDDLEFQKVLKMIKYVFSDTNIRITIGTNKKSWWKTHCSGSDSMEDDIVSQPGVAELNKTLLDESM